MTETSPQRIVVTGGAGFIGSHVADLWLARDCEVLVVDNLATGSRDNLPARAAFTELDIRDAASLAAAFAVFQPDVVCHLAAQASVTASAKDPGFDCSVNVVGTLNVLEAARAVGARVVFASTGGALYGDAAPRPTAETWAATPESPYGAAKLAAEAYVGTWARLHGMPNVVLRLGNVYGPRQNPHGEAGVVSIFSTLLRDGGTPVVYGFGDPTRDYVNVGDVARAFVLAGLSGRTGVYNVGTGSGSTVNEVLAALQSAAGTAVEPQKLPLRPGELEHSLLDSSLIDRELGWRAQVTLADGLDETYAWFAARGG